MLPTWLSLTPQARTLCYELSERATPATESPSPVADPAGARVIRTNALGGLIHEYRLVA
ncbi:MAG: hypothetical protein ACYCS7_14420 [Acidimicrobiales bacterium]